MSSFITPPNNGCFLRWAGGKRWLAPALAKFLREIEYAKYIEPFIGGGSVFFEVRPHCALLGDTNADLIATYSQIKRNHKMVENGLRNIPVNIENFNSIKSAYCADDLQRAIRFIYLNRTCYNGLYRTNKRGEFNVPFGGGDRNCESILNGGHLGLASKSLKNCKLICRDFEVSIDSAEEGDFIYCDPTYTVAHGGNGFVRYNEKVFSWSDQMRLRASVVRAVARGANVVVSNADHSSLRELYSPYKPIVVGRNSMMAAKVGRGHFSEYLFLLSSEPRLRRYLKRELDRYSLIT